MGYYTDYYLEIKNVPDESSVSMISSALDSIGIRFAFSAPDYLDRTAWFGCAEGANWYCYKDDMIDISKQFHDMVFKLHGEGEDREDIWDAYFKNGECEICDYLITKPMPKKIAWD